MIVRATYRGPWRIDLDVRIPVPLPASRASLVRAIVAGLEAAGAPRPASVGVILTDDGELAALNEAHLGHQGSTDVLSFPLLPTEAYPPHSGGTTRGGTTGGGTTGGASRGTTRGGTTRGGTSSEPAGASAAAPRFALPPGRRPHLGDIVVSVERAIEQAEAGRGGQTGDVRWAPADELRLLVTHGTLHLCGWDHADPVEEASMRSLERRLLGR